MPVVVTPEGEYLQDTTVIIDRLEQCFPENPIYPDTPFQNLVAQLLEVYGDEGLLMAALHYRWQYKRQNLGHILQQFGSVIKPQWPRGAQRMAALPVAWYFGRKYKPYVGLIPENEPLVEKSTEAFLRDIDRHLEDHDFLLGSRPSIGDFGLIAPLYANLASDPYPKQWMKDIAPRVFAWTERMQTPTGEAGHFLPNDEVPETLYPILAQMFQEQFPLLIDTMAKVADWVATHPDNDHLPRTIGRHDFILDGITAERAVLPYQQWMFQRPLRCYQNMTEMERQRIDPVLEQLGGLKGLQTKIPLPLAYKNHRVVVA